MKRKILICLAAVVLSGCATHEFAFEDGWRYGYQDGLRDGVYMTKATEEGVEKDALVQVVNSRAKQSMKKDLANWKAGGSPYPYKP